MVPPDDDFTTGVVVHKYGGSSLATSVQIHAVARRISQVHHGGGAAVVVVSARGKTTDSLLRLAGEFHSAPPARELDQLLATGESTSAALLAIALDSHAVPAVALTGPQAGILATGPHGAGIIVAVDTERVRRLLRNGYVVVVAGFQAMTAGGDVITLGRGGSDTTAVALAAELGTGRCEIYTDVAGVHTADPRVLPVARLISELEVGVMAEMSFAGAKVMHSRAVELAAVYGVDVHVMHSAVVGAGTVIHGNHGGDMFESRAGVAAIVHDLDAARVKMRFRGRDQDAAPELFRFFAEKSVTVDMTALSHGTGESSLGLTLRRSDLGRVHGALRSVVEHLSGSIEVDDAVGKLSAVGVGLSSRPDYTARMIDALSAVGIATTSMSTSQSRISATVHADDVIRAVAVLHGEFGLDATGDRSVPAAAGQP